MAENAPLRRHRPARDKICVRLEGVERGSRGGRDAAHSANCPPPPAYPPLGDGVWLIDRRNTSTARLGPFGAEIAAWLGRHDAGAALSGV